ncbi:MAG: hypothetical protein KDC54_18895, partial [Lewinella sp.]|nr:hypothetical protein [Lewinella sp.]
MEAVEPRKRTPSGSPSMAVQLLHGFIEWILSAFAILGLTFLHYDFGERFYSWGKLISSWSAAFLVIWLLEQSSQVAASDITLLFIVWIAFGVMAGIHRIRIRRRNKQGILWHSRYIGDSYLERFLPFRLPLIHRLIEPVVLVVIGWLVSFFNTPLSFSIYTSGVMMCLQANFRYYELKHQILDMQDNLIESQFLHSAIQQRPSSETAGLMMPEETVEIMKNVVNFTENKGIEPPAYLRDLKPILESGYEELRTKSPAPPAPPPYSSDDDDLDALRTKK